MEYEVWCSYFVEARNEEEADHKFRKAVKEKMVDLVIEKESAG